MTENEILKAAIARTLIPEYHKIMEEASDYHEFSTSFQKRMDKLIRRRRKPYYRFINTAGKRIALIVLSFLTISFTAVMSVEALRTPFLDFIMNIFSNHSEVRGIDDSGDYPETIENDYVITFDLSEYSIVNDEKNDFFHKAFYKNNNNNNIIYYFQYTVQEYNRNLNTEKAVIEQVEINGQEAFGYLDNHNYYTLFWNNGEYVIQISSTVGKDTLIEMAKSVKKVE